jgi:hypothetical protein
MSVDTSVYQSGAQSLRVDFHGESNPETPLVSQLLIVKPNTAYRVSLQARAKDFVSPAAPIVSITDESADKVSVLAQSPLLPVNQDPWSQINLDFKTGPQTHAVMIRLGRQACAAGPCAAFGTLWFDSFRMDQH